MNLLSMMSSMLGDSDVTGALSNNTKVSSGALGKLLALALPALLKQLTKNASTEDGARSLFNALSQHTTDRSLADQLNNVDTEDGAKIIGHIFGDSTESEISSLAEQAGVSTEEASGVLNNIAPSLLSNLSSVVTNGLPEEQEESGGILSTIGRIFGGQKEDTSGFDGTNLLNILTSLKQ